MLFYGFHIGKCFELYGEYSESEVEAMRGFVKPGDTVLDIGANIGDLTLPLSQMVGPTGRVIAVECFPTAYNVLCGNLALNQVQNVQTINAFVRKTETAREDFVAGKKDYKTVTIDELALDSCRLIKIDVDGNELDVLKSGDATLKRLRPVLYVENDMRDKSQALMQYMMDMDYNLYWHVAPIFSQDNFYGNPVNHWHPNGIVSLMVLAVPKELKMNIVGLPQIKSADEWGMPE
jgi:hypothetical protein